MPQPPPPCGTDGGAQRHRRLKEPVCGPCQRAASAYVRGWRKRHKCAPGLGWPLREEEVGGG